MAAGDCYRDDRRHKHDSPWSGAVHRMAVAMKLRAAIEENADGE
jgi:hypothetical protein